MDLRISLKRLSVSAVLMTAFVLANQLARAQEGKQPPRFKIDARTPVAELLPAWPFKPAKLPVLVNDDVANVPELMLSEPMSSKQTKDEALAMIEQTVAKINHLNKKNPDGFMEALLARRSDLKGLPFRMGKDCRTSPEKAILFNVPGRLVQMRAGEARLKADKDKAAIMEKAWASIRAIKGPRGAIKLGEPLAQDNFEGVVATVAAQILAPESASVRVSLANFLAEVPHDNATQALAKLAIFSPEEEVRSAAIAGLKPRRARDYTDVLMHGFEYPLPAVARRAAQALVELDCKDLVPSLVKVLEQPDPRLPIKKTVDGKGVLVVRELVRINHHRNCLLCHSPGNTKDVPFGVLKVAVPLPTEPFPPPSRLLGYYETPPVTPDHVVRIDTTYLRQDFSLMMPVPDAKPWPEQQRFDFLVRTRELTPALAADWWEDFAQRTAKEASPYHLAASYALRGLTGRDAEPTAQAWRETLKPVLSEVK